MAFAKPISEQIVLWIVEQLKTVTIDDDFTFDVEVHRGDESGEPVAAVNKGVAITVIAKAPQRDERLSYCGRDAYHLKVGILCNIRYDGESTTPLGELQARVVADCHKALGPDPQCGGLASDTVPEAAQAGLDERVPTADIQLDILFFTGRNNPYSLN